MSPMHHYLYYKLDTILSITGRFTMFSMQMSVCQQNILNVTSSVFWHVWVHLACTTNIFLWKLLQRDVFISLDHYVVNSCYI